MQTRTSAPLRTFLTLGAASAFLAVTLGAFGAHALRSRFTPEMMEVYKTGVNYQMTHALALILLALVSDRAGGDRRTWIRIGWLFVAGTVLFSGSLYLLSLTGVKVWGAVTPFGGLCFLGAWILFVVSIGKIQE